MLLIGRDDRYNMVAALYQSFVHEHVGRYGAVGNGDVRNRRIGVELRNGCSQAVRPLDITVGEFHRKEFV